MLSVLLACSASGPPPPEIQGVWRSTSAAYAERSFEVRPDSVIFGTGKYTMDIWPITGVTAEPSEVPAADTLYTVHYVGPDQETLAVRVHYAAGPPATLRFDNRREVWLRAPAPASPAKKGRKS